MTYHYNPHYSETLYLQDGSPVEIRLIRADDKALLSEGLTRLSDENRYRRFFSPKPSLSKRELTFLTEVDGEDHFAVGAKRPGKNGKGLGIARFFRSKDDPTLAEPAIVVVDEAQGLGLGRALFLRLIAAARERGIRRFRGELLATNGAIKHLLRDLSDDVHFTSRGREEVMDFPIPNLTPELVDNHPDLKDTPFAALLEAVSGGQLVLRQTLDGLRGWLRPR